MALRLPIFNPITPNHLLKLKTNIKDILNKDSISVVLQSYLKKIMSHDILESSEARVMCDWHEHLDHMSLLQFTNYISNHIEDSPDLMNLIIEYFKDLKQPKVIGILMKVKAIQSRLNEEKNNAFNFFLSNKSTDTLNADEVVEYIENLYLIESGTFSSGQQFVASGILPESDLSKLFENSFDKLLNFILKCGLEDSLAQAKYLDRQLGILIKQKETEVTARAFRKELGYLKYVSYVESKFTPAETSTLFNYLQLKKLISRFEEAVEILSEEEVVRGTFWKSNIQLLDGVKMKKSALSKYRIAVAFYVNEFVFCDFGPTGNKIHVYDRDVFLKQIQSTENWQRDELLTQKLQPNKYPHQVHAWQDKTLQLIKRARRHE